MLSGFELYLRWVPLKIFSDRTAFRLTADVEAARVLCGFNLVADKPQA